jgi:hypothetical protein
MRLRSLFASAVLLGTLTACAGPLDSHLVTDKGDAAYFQRLNPLFAKMSEDEQLAFNWAVSDLDIPTLNQRYPNARPRQIIHAEAQRVLDTYPAKVAELQPQLERHKALQAQLARLQASDASFWIDRDFHGLQPRIRATFSNGSDLAFSSTGWNASLYIDGQEQPVATTELNIDHRERNGLHPGQQQQVTFTVGFVTGDENWTTLEIRNAKKCRVLIEPVDRNITDLGNRGYAVPDVRSEIERLEGVMAAARKWQDI